MLGFYDSAVSNGRLPDRSRTGSLPQDITRSAHESEDFGARSPGLPVPRIDATPMPLPTSAYGLRSRWLARPSSQDSFIPYSKPVYPGAFNVPFFLSGIPAKSGVGGGIVAVVPGEIGIGTFSPPLDERGNSVRGIQVCRELSERFGLHAFETRGAAQSLRAAFHKSKAGP